MAHFAPLGTGNDDSRSRSSSSPLRGPRRTIKQLASAITGIKSPAPAAAAATMTKKNSRRSSVGTDSTQESSEKTKSPGATAKLPSIPSAPDLKSPTIARGAREQSPTRLGGTVLRKTRRRASLGPTATLTGSTAAAAKGTGAVTGPKNKRRSSLSNAPTTGSQPLVHSAPPAASPPNTATRKPTSATAIAARQRRVKSLGSAALSSQIPKNLVPREVAPLPKRAPKRHSQANPVLQPETPSYMNVKKAAPQDASVSGSSDQSAAKLKKAAAPKAAATTTTSKKGVVKKTRVRAGSFAGNGQAAGENIASPVSQKTILSGDSSKRTAPKPHVSQLSSGSEQSPMQAQQSPRRTGSRRLSATGLSPQRSPSSQSNSSASRRLQQRVHQVKAHQEQLQLHAELPLDSGPTTSSIFKSEQIDVSPDIPIRQKSVESNTLQNMMDETEAAWDDYDGEQDIVEEQVINHPQQSIIHLSPVYQYARACQWDLVVEECDLNPRDAKCVNDMDGTTALHLAVMSRTNPAMRDGLIPGYDPAPLEVIEVLLMAAPEAAITRCASKKYTPLHYACLVADKYYDMEDASKMIELIIKYAEHSPYVFTDDGFSALDVHILSYSRLHVDPEEAPSGPKTSTGVLKTLLKRAYSLAEARTYRNKMRSPIELLYRSNMDQFKEAVEENLVDETMGVRAATVTSARSRFSDWWALKWTILILKYADSATPDGEGRSFCALQAAARMPACPTPILSLLCQMFPKQIEDRDPRDNLFNLPLHHVCSWRCDKEIISGDPFVVRRKLQAIELLLDLYPEASRTTNNQGETPLQLAIESGTNWNGGLSLLVKSCPKALKFPRKLRSVADINHNVLSVSLHNQALRTEREEEDFVRALNGMYPFMIAAVFARIPESRRRDPAFLYDGQTIEEHRMQIHKKELDSLTAVYGLLRTKPDALSRYRSAMAGNGHKPGR